MAHFDNRLPFPALERPGAAETGRLAVSIINYHDIKTLLVASGELIPAGQAEERVPIAFGLYSIILSHPSALPAPFCDYASLAASRVIYLGKAAKRPLSERLVQNDLRHRGAGTFFRSLGAILGYRPPQGSLTGKINRLNYKFSSDDTELIVEWINQHLAIRFLCLAQEGIAFERALITELRPILNIDGNPSALAELIEVREQCRVIARSFAP